MLREIKAKFSKTRTLPQLQLVGDRSIVLYRYTLSENPTISCPIVEVLVEGSEVLRPLSRQPINEGPRHAIWEPVKNGWYAKSKNEAA